MISHHYVAVHAADLAKGGEAQKPEWCEACKLIDNLKGWVMARTIFAGEMLTLIAASQMTEDCLVKDYNGA